MSDETRPDGQDRVARLRDEIHRTHHDRLTLSGYLGSTTNLLRGGPLYRQSLYDDGMEWLRETLPLVQTGGEPTAELVDTLETFHDEFTAHAAYDVAKAAKTLMKGKALVGQRPKLLRQVADVEMRCVYYSWLLGHRAAGQRVAALAFGLAMDSPGELAQVEYLGTAVAAAMFRGTMNRERAHLDGIVQAARFGALAKDFLKARATTTAEQKGAISEAVGQALRDLMDNPHGGVQADIIQVMPEPMIGDGEIEVEAPPLQGLVPVPTLDHLPGSYPTEGRPSSTSWSVKGQYGHVSGRMLPFVEAMAPKEFLDVLVPEFPFAERALRTLAQDLVGARSARFRPSALLGKPGIGKTRLLRRVAEVCGLPFTLYPAAGQADGAFGGTSRQ
jgi:hypothetical protein